MAIIDREFSKAILKINSQNSLLLNTLKRLDKDLFFPATIIGNFEHRFLIKNELVTNKINYRSIFLEPMRKNTMASITICTLDIIKKDPNANILVLPADHIINEKKEFIKIIRNSIKIVDQGLIATFGIRPNNPSTSMGYITSGKKKNGQCLYNQKFH